MATNPSNTTPRLTFPDPVSPETPATPRPGVDAREALQALLAFSTLHDQIQRRRQEDAERYAAGLGPAPDPWATDGFLLDEVLQLVAERAQAMTAAEGIAIALAEGDEIICRASLGTMAPDRGMRIDPRAGFSGACLRARRIIRCDDSEHDPRVDVQACRRLGTRSMVAIPLLGQDSVIGILEAFSTEPFGFSDNHVRGLSLLGELILAALKPEDEERIVRAAKIAAAEFDAQEVERLRKMPSDLAPPSTASELPELSHAPLEFSKEDIAPPLDFESTPTLSSRLLIPLVAVLIAACALGLYGWKRHARANAPATQTALPAIPAPKPLPAVITNTEPAPSLSPSLATQQPATAADAAPSVALPAGPAQVSAIRHWSENGVSIVAIELQSEVQYETHRLDNPDRIYFDLQDTRLAPSLNSKVIEVGEPILAKIRVAQLTEGVTRVVLDTKAVATFSVRLEENPYRLLVEVRGPETKPILPKAVPSPAPRAQTPAPKPSAAAPVAIPALTLPQPTTAQPVPVVPQPKPRAQADHVKIVIDAGHGGWDLGTVGRRGLLEKDLVLDVAQRLGTLVETRLGGEVVFTRKDDNYLSLEQRAELANSAQADLFVSVHANYSDLASARGVETYYSSFFSPPEARDASLGVNPNAKPVTQAKLSSNALRDKVEGSRKLAADVQHALFESLAGANPGIRNRGVREASYVVLAGTEMPSVLAEISFVSSPTDEERLRSADYREQIAEALYKGVANYVASTRHVKIAYVAGSPSGK